MNTCERYAALLDLFVDGELSLEEMLEVQAHLDECPACRAYVDDALAMQAAFPDAEETEVPEGFAAGVMAAIQADITACPTHSHKKKKTPWAGVLASLVACCAIVILQQNGPLAGSNESASVAYDTAVEECAAESDDAAAYSYTALEDAAEEETAAETPNTSLNDSVQARAEQEPAAEETETITTDAAPAESIPFVKEIDLTGDSWVEHENVVFACVVFLPADRVGTVLDGYEGKPYVTDEGIVGTGYAMEQAEYEEILYDFFDYTHGPELDPERTTDLCCIVVTE